MFLPGGSFEGFPFAVYVIAVVGEAVIIGWVYNSTAGSVLHAAITHTSVNASFGVLITAMTVADVSVDAFYGASAVVIRLAVAVIVSRTDPSTLR